MKIKRIPTFLIFIGTLFLFSCEEDLSNLELDFKQSKEATLTDSDFQQQNSQIGGALDSAGGLDGNSSTFY